MRKIGITGTHGAGKSTLAFKLAHYLKQNNRNVDVVQERIRLCPFPYNENMVIETTMWAYHAQVKRELEAQANGFDTIICDRTVFDCFIYAEYRNMNNEQLCCFRNAAEMWLKTYDKIIFITPTEKIRPDGVRSLDEDFQKGIHDLMLSATMDLSESLDLDITYTNTKDLISDKFNLRNLC